MEEKEGQPSIQVDRLAIVKPEKRCLTADREFQNEISKLQQCADSSLKGFVPLVDAFKYSKLEKEKHRLILPWWEQNLEEAIPYLTPCQKVAVCLQLLEIMIDFEEKGFIYRDLKPANLLIKFDKADCQLAICDMGFLYHRNFNESCKVKGSPRWIAPEYAHTMVFDNSIEKEAVDNYL